MSISVPVDRRRIRKGEGAMSQFMVMIHENEATEAALTPSETMALLEGHAAYEDKLRAASVYLEGERLRPSAEGRRVRRRDGQVHVEAGPFPDKVLRGYCVLSAESVEAAALLATQCPVPPEAELDVRPLMKGSLAPNKTNERGPVFAFAVLGSAPNEQGWVDVMDRIDESTGSHFPVGRFLGGVRLEAPGRGRRVASAGGRRAVFDGPFLESKEVIGGLFFMRVASLDEAVDWASKSAFMKHGALEIRELWRS
jgi:hypothetical protein